MKFRESKKSENDEDKEAAEALRARKQALEKESLELSAKIKDTNIDWSKLTSEAQNAAKKAVSLAASKAHLQDNKAATLKSKSEHLQDSDHAPDQADQQLFRDIEKVETENNGLREQIQTVSKEGRARVNALIKRGEDLDLEFGRAETEAKLFSRKKRVDVLEASVKTLEETVEGQKKALAKSGEDLQGARSVLGKLKGVKDIM